MDLDNTLFRVFEAKHLDEINHLKEVITSDVLREILLDFPVEIGVIVKKIGISEDKYRQLAIKYPHTCAVAVAVFGSDVIDTVSRRVEKDALFLEATDSVKAAMAKR